MTKKQYSIQDEIDRLYSKARHDEAQALRHARIEARVEGRLEGIFEVKIEIAKNLHQANTPIETIAKVIGLSQDEMEKIA